MGKILHTLHLYLGLAAAFVLALVGLSGALLSYEKEILRFLNQDSYTITPTEEGKLQTAVLIERFLNQKEGAKILRITLSQNPSESAQIAIASKAHKKGENIFVNPYTGEILPSVRGEEFFHTIEDLHRRLMLHQVGKQIVGASVLILLFLLASGVYLYMPKIKRGFVLALKFNPKAKGRAFLYAIHGALGMWVLPLYLLASLSGLYWSYEWYNKALHAISGVEKPQRQGAGGEMKKGSSGSEQKGREGALIDIHAIEKAFEGFELHAKNLYSQTTLLVPQNGVKYTFFYLDRNPQHPYARNRFELDLKTGEVVKHERYEDKMLGDKLISSMLALHTGMFFGAIGQALMFLASLLMPLFGITGLLLYMKKRKSGRI
ncbi:MAG: PepSY-associated TM helix domain-containing protein [Sulfurimonadaceae bacterium]